LRREGRFQFLVEVLTAVKVRLRDEEAVTVVVGVYDQQAITFGPPLWMLSVDGSNTSIPDASTIRAVFMPVDPPVRLTEDDEQIAGKLRMVHSMICDAKADQLAE
jgi:hypothetical protein